jgi:hypothetical protein
MENKMPISLHQKIGKYDWAKHSAELTHIKTAKGINIHTSITVMSSNTTPAGGATPSLAACPLL